MSQHAQVPQEQSVTERINAPDQHVTPSDGPPAEWTAPECAMWAAFRKSTELSLADSDPTQNNPAVGADWGDSRTLRAEVVSQLLLHPPKVEPGKPDRFILTGARISGYLDLGCGGPAAFSFDSCRFDKPINLNDAKAAFVGFNRCYFPGLDGSRLKCSGPVWLEHCQTDGLIDLEDSFIEGEVRLAGAKLQGDENVHRMCLCGATVNGDLLMADALIDGSVGLHSAIVNGSIFLRNARIASSGNTIDGRLIKVAGDISASPSFRSTGNFNMEGAHIGGQLMLRGAHLSNKGKTALDLDHARIDLGLAGRELVTEGKVLIHHANIGCQVSFAAARLSNPNDTALRADHLIVDGSLFFNNDAHVDGKINLHGAKIGCTLNLETGQLGASNSPAVYADGISVGGDILAAKCKVTGGFDLGNSKIGGDADFGHAQLSHSRYALVADRAQIAGSLLMTNDFTAEGMIKLTDALVGTTFEFRDSQFSCPDKPCLAASGLRVQGDIIGDRVKILGLLDLTAIDAHGDVRIADAEITGIRAQEFSLGSPLDQRRGGAWRAIAVRMTGARVAGDLDLRGTVLKQSLILSKLSVSRSILLTGACLESTDGPAIVAAGAKADALALQFKSRPTMSIDLSSVSVVSLADTALSWPDSASVNINGFSYERLDSDLTPNQRLEWLAHAAQSYSPQPYEQLASYYVVNGNADLARRVRLESIRRSYSTRGALGRAWGHLQDWSVGFGYRPLRAAVIFATFWLAASIYFAVGTGPCLRFGVHWPNLCPTALSGHLSWNPWLYSFDLLVPVINLGYKTAWDASGVAEAVSLTLIAAGWVLTTTIIAAAARHLRRP
jgi:hypothetical protein